MYLILKLIKVAKLFPPFSYIIIWIDDCETRECICISVCPINQLSHGSLIIINLPSLIATSNRINQDPALLSYIVKDSTNLPAVNYLCNFNTGKILYRQRNLSVKILNAIMRRDSISIFIIRSSISPKYYTCW